jgi:hypothetical protein
MDPAPSIRPGGKLRRVIGRAPDDGRTASATGFHAGAPAGQVPMTNQACLGGIVVGDGAAVAVVGALNVSPESFYAGSIATRADDLLRAAEAMARARDVDGPLSRGPNLRARGGRPARHGRRPARARPRRARLRRHEPRPPGPGCPRGGGADHQRRDRAHRRPRGGRAGGSRGRRDHPDGVRAGRCRRRESDQRRGRPAR